MPPVAIVGALASAAFASVGGAAFFGLVGWQAFFARFAISFIISQLGSALQPKPKSPSAGALSDRAQQRTQQITQSVGPSEVVLGLVYKSGTVVYAANTEENKYTHIVIVLADHEVAGIDEVGVGNDIVPSDYLDANGNVVFGKYKDKLRIKKHLGTADQVADSDLVSEVNEWTVNHRLRGRAYIYVRYERDQKLFPSAPNFAAIVRGAKIADSRSGLTAWTPNIDLQAEYWLKDAKFGLGVPSANVDQTVQEASANACEEMVETQEIDINVTHLDLTAEITQVLAGTDEIVIDDEDEVFVFSLGTVVQLTTDDTLPAGLAAATNYYTIPGERKDGKSKMKLAASLADAIAGTVVDITGAGTGTHTLVKPSNDILTLEGNYLPWLHGDQVELVTAGTLPAGLSEGVDYYVIPYQFGGIPRIKLAASLADSLANDGAGVAVAYTDAGDGLITVRKTHEARYFGGGVLSSDRSGGDGLKDILTAMCGRPTNTGGYWKLFAGVWRAPVETLDEDDLRGAMQTQTANPLGQFFNTVIGTYVSPMNNWQGADYPQVRNATYIADDMGEVQQTQLDLPFTQKSSTAQRIAKIKLDLHRQEIVSTCPAKLTALQYMPMDTLYVDNTRNGWDGKVFEVQTWGLDFGQSKEGPMPGITMVLQETASACYDWDSGNEITTDPAPNTNLPDPFTVPQLQGLSINSIAIGTRDGDTVYRAMATWSPINNAFVTRGGKIHFQYRLTGTTQWIRLPTIPGDASAADIFSGALGTGYDLEAWLENSLGAQGRVSSLDDLSLGSPGGVGTTDDWGLVSDAPTTNNDWEGVADAVGTTNDWGGVA
ncbi:MAG: phage tail protein [Alphaproteobacteria bacterium]